MISRDSLAMASYSGPRAAMAATLRSTADETAEANEGDELVDLDEAGARAAGGTGVATLRVTGAGESTDEMDGCAGGTRGKGGRIAGGASDDDGNDDGNDGGGTTGLVNTGAAGAAGDDVAGIPVAGRTGAAIEGTAGVGRVIGVGIATGRGAAGLAKTGGLTDGKPIIVRLSGGLAAAGAEVDGCGVMPVRTVGMEVVGRAPGIKDGRGAMDGGGVAADGAETAGRLPDGRAAGLAAHAAGACAGEGVGPLSMVISP
jgi:hypothetical protein